MRIGELGARAGLAPKTIRYYEQVGLVPPPKRTPAGYRDYGEDALSRLRFIRAGHSVGLSLGEIREVLAFRDRGEPPCRHVASLIEHHASELAVRISILERMREDLVRLAKKAASLSGKEPPPESFCLIIEPDSGERSVD